MKKILLPVLALMPLCAAAQTMIVNLQSGESIEYNISDIANLSFAESVDPDQPKDVSLSVFTDQAVLDAVKPFDTNNDGVLSPNEIAEITTLNLTNSTVASLDGVQYLTEITYLNLSYCSRLTALDLSGILSKLETLSIAGDRGLEAVTLGEKPALKEVFAQMSNISSLDISGAPIIEWLSLMDTKFTSLNFTSETLKNISAGSPDESILNNIDLSGCPNLTTLALYANKQTTALDISMLTALESLTLNNSAITTFSTEKNRQLKSLNLNYNASLKTLDVSKSLKLSTLSCLQCWDLEKVIMTEGQVIGTMNGIEEYIIERVPREYPEDVATELTDATFRQAMLEIADTNNDGKISGDEAAALTIFNAPNKGLTTVDFEYFPNIVEIDLSDNQIQTIDLSALTKLEKLNLNNNKLESLDISRLEALKYLYANNNLLESATGFQYYITEVELAHNNLSSIDIEYRSSLKRVDVSYNQITYAEIFSNSALEYMDVSHNQIQEMNLWSLSAMKTAKLNDNPFTQLDQVNRWKKLENINCSNTNITTLDLSQTTTLNECIATGCNNLTTIYIGTNDSSKVQTDSNVNIINGSPE